MAYKLSEDVQLSDYVVDLERDGGDINPLLFDLLSIASPHGSAGEDDVRDRIVHELKEYGQRYQIDSYGNLIVRIGKRRKHRTLFSAHMDTVHDIPGDVRLVMTENAPDPSEDGMVYGMMKERPVRYKVGTSEKTYTYGELRSLAGEYGAKWWRLKPIAMSPRFYHMEELESYSAKEGKIIEKAPIIERVLLDEVWTPSVLGADDKLGCYILLRLIRAGVDGVYVFHVGEEVGCLGSNHILKHGYGDVLKDIDRAIAFDRMNYGDIINSQSGTTCASQAFCKELAAQLNEHMPAYQKFSPSVRGVFTDTAVYMDDVPECTNLSVGYFAQHTDAEHFDLLWLESILIPALLQVDWSGLPVKRDPKAITKAWQGYGAYYYSRHDSGGWGGYIGFDDEIDWIDDPNNPDNDDEDEEPNVEDDDDRRVVPFGNPQDWEDAEKVWEEQGYEAPWNVSPYTPWSKIPHWRPDDGLWSICSEAQMKLIMRKYLLSGGKPIERAVEDMYSICQELDMLKSEVLG